jgi:DNA-binding NarL/FixJ family response regulator
VTIRCLVVDDDPAFIELARQVLDGDGGISIVGSAANSAEAVARVAELRPDLVLVDVRLGDESGVALARRIADHGSQARVILVSSYRQSDLAGVLPDNEGIGFISKVDLSSTTVRDALS